MADDLQLTADIWQLIGPSSKRTPGPPTRHRCQSRRGDVGDVGQVVIQTTPRSTPLDDYPILSPEDNLPDDFGRMPEFCGMRGTWIT